MAEIDPEEILRKLPPPEVNYTLPEIRAVKQPVALPDYSTAEHYGKPAQSRREFERSLKSVKSLLETQAVTSTMKLIGNLANKQQKITGLPLEHNPGRRTRIQDRMLKLLNLMPSHKQPIQKEQ